MSTTSSSRADRRGLAAGLGALALLAACTSDAPARDAPDAPRPARQTEVQPGGEPTRDAPLAVREASIRPLDPADAPLAGEAFLQAAADPLQIEVRLAQALEPVLSTSSPIIVLNGRRLTDTRVRADRPDHLVAFLPDRAGLRETNVVHAEWLDRAGTRSNEVTATLR
jgi:hypothetical protein